MEDGVLYRRVTEGGQSFQAIYVPKTPPNLIQSILKAAHDDLVTMDSQELTQPSESYTTGRASRRMSGNTAPTATHANCTGLPQSSLKLSTSNHQ